MRFLRTIQGSCIEHPCARVVLSANALVAAVDLSGAEYFQIPPMLKSFKWPDSLCWPGSGVNRCNT
jgi:hypothetical protein